MKKGEGIIWRDKYALLEKELEQERAAHQKTKQKLDTITLALRTIVDES